MSEPVEMEIIWEYKKISRLDVIRLIEGGWVTTKRRNIAGQEYWRCEFCGAHLKPKAKDVQKHFQRESPKFEDIYCPVAKGALEGMRK